MVWDRQCLEDYEQKDDSISELINDKDVYRTVPATPGLLISCRLKRHTLVLIGPSK